MTMRELIAWSLIALLVFGAIAAIWLAMTSQRRKRRRERRGEERPYAGGGVVQRGDDGGTADEG